ncbi:replicative DNA helicase [Metabacillus malikii]|uniref:DNA 5'-3' helicase n=1 Tax=Metabacillus malikii TaxID=1504265 RepID=A0ABT9ZK62_9BACI|nr:DnaB-like helicase C-terminal domain-containing protein [Metabacillus malikii]MDQ0232679.1 replicative DNA helicase [Metabacillus malikii]
MSTAEKALLGTLIKHDYLIKETRIRPEHLENKQHSNLLQIILDMNQKGQDVDLISLTTLHHLDSVGGMSYLSELESFANPAKLESIEKLILDIWKEREKRNILTVATTNNWDIAKIISSLDNLTQAKSDDYTSIHQALSKIYDAPWEEQHEDTGITTGIQELDKVTGGFQNGEVTILAARPSMGKTDVMLHLAKHAGWAGNLPIVFSLEMPEKLITKRLVASTGGINRTKMRHPMRSLTDKQKRNWANVIDELSKTEMHIFDGSGQTVAEIRAKARKVIHQYPNKKPILFIDYLTLIQSDKTFGGNAHQQVTDVSESLKFMAKDFDCPIVCLAQLNRSVESRSIKRPVMSDIRESGSVEQDADVILFLFRKGYYNPEDEDKTLEIIISKNRNGPVGSVFVHYNHFTGEIIPLSKYNES